MQRRIFLGAALARALRADATQEIYELFASMASGLSEGNPEQFLQAFDRAMRGFEDLAANVRALVQQAEVLSAVEVLEDSGDAQQRNVKLDWFLQITLRANSGSLTRRREIVKCRLEKQKKKWRIMAIEPAALFAPPKIGQ